MTIMHHPTDETLAGFAAGTLDECRRLVVATHLARCPACRRSARAFEHVGGALLVDAPPAALAFDALPRALARLDATPVESRRPTGEPREPMAHYEMGAWRWIGRGVHWRPLTVPSEDGGRVFMLKAAPGIRMPRHRHAGTEWTCVLEGAFRHDLGRFGPGDFDEADAAVEHWPVIEDGVPCICIVALHGRIEFQGRLGRLLQSLVRL